ncbi:MAG: glutaredoxin domain-containing protein, partial [Afipia sp.]
SAAFTEFDVAVDPNWRAEMVERSSGGATFPQIFIDKQHVGGCDELYALDREGRLDGLLAGQKVSS